MTASITTVHDSPVLFFGPDVVVDERPDELLALCGPGWQFVLRQVTRGLREAVRALADGGATRTEMTERLIRHDGTASLARLYFQLDQWRRCGMLGARLSTPAGPLATLEPLPVPDSSRPFEIATVGADAKVRLSPFACFRRVNDALVIESATTGARVTLRDRRAWPLCVALIAAHRREDVPSAGCDLSAADARAVCDLLYQAQILVDDRSQDRDGDDRDDPLGWWQFHDLLFHTRSRHGRHTGGVGGTFRFSGTSDPEPAVKPPMSTQVVRLHRPDVDRLCARDTPFTRVVEQRRSRREYGDAPLSERALGGFLYRAARVRATSTTGAREVSDRPYPSGGASYELELYLSVASCGQLVAGLYHYDPSKHRLHRLAPLNPDVRALLDDAARALGRLDPPPVLVTIAARFRRVFWKYESMGYALILQNVGVLYQTMYLVATAMGLAPCALGSGNPDAFARASGLDRFVETSVGEFALGPATDSAHTLMARRTA